MSNRYFSIQQHVFDLQFNNRSGVHELQNRISRIFHDRLRGVLDAQFQSVVPEDMYLRFDNLTLDLGSVSLEHLEQELEIKLADVFRNELMLQVKMIEEKRAAAGSQRVEAFNSGDEILLEHFLRYGTLPWWRSGNGFSLAEIVDRLFEAHPAVLKGLVIRLGQYEYVRKRIAFQFPGSSIERIITVLEPVEAAFIFGYHRQVVRLQEKENIVKTEVTAFEKETWHFIITYLLDDRGSEFNRRSFVKSTLQRMASGFNVLYDQLLRLFYEAHVRHQQNDPIISSLEAIIHELVVESASFTKATDGALATTSGAGDSLADDLELIAYYLRYGYLPANSDAVERGALVSKLEKLADSYRSSLKQMLLELSAVGGFSERFYQLTGHEKGNRLLVTLYPNSAAQLWMLRNVLERLGRANRMLATDEKLFRKIVLQQLLRYGNSDIDGTLVLRHTIDAITVVSGHDTGRWLTTVYEGIRTEFPQGIIQSTLPEKIAQLYHQRDSFGVGNGEVPAMDEAMPREDKTLKNLLVFAVEHGFFPWWGREWIGQKTFQQLFGELINQSPYDALYIVKNAGRVEPAQRRLLSWLSQENWQTIWALIPAGREFLETLLQAELMVSVFAGADANSYTDVLFQVGWKVLGLHAYRAFSPASFYMLLVQRMAGLHDLPYHTVAHKLDDVARSVGNMPSTAPLRKVLADIVRQWKQPQTAVEVFSFEHYLTATFGTILDVAQFPAAGRQRPGKRDSAWQQYFKSIPETAKQVLKPDVDGLLRYYIAWNRFPARIPLYDDGSAALFAASLFRLAYAIDANWLGLLVGSQAVTAERKKQLSALFSSNKGGMESTLYRLLSNVNGPHGITGITGLDTEPQQEALPQMLRQYLSEPEGQLHSSLDKMAGWLAFYLQTNRMPDELHGHESPGELLKLIFETLFQYRRETVNTLLRSPLHLHEAALYLFDQFSEQAGGRDKELAQYLAPFREQALQAAIIEMPDEKTILREAAAPSDQTGVSYWRSLIDKLLSDQTGSHDDSAIMEAVRRLFDLQPSLLRNLLSDTRFSPADRLRLYSIFITTQGYADRQLAGMLSGYWEHDIRRLLGDSRTTGTGLLSLHDFSGTVDTVVSSLQALSGSPVLLAKLLDAGQHHALQLWLDTSGNGWGGSTFVDIQALQDLFAGSSNDKFERERMIFFFRQFHLRFLSGAVHLRSLEAYLAALFAHLAVHSNELTAVWLADITKTTTREAIRPLPERALVPLQQHIARLTDLLQNNPPLISGNTPGQEAAGRKSERDRYDQMLREEMTEASRIEQKERDSEAAKMQEDPRNKIYIRNAGLVLLHPFLATYFARVGLLDEGKFINEAAQYRAVMLLQYLAYGRSETDEFELPLNKVLCGLPVAAPVPAQVDLTEDEAAVAEELFQVIFQRWDKMKNTSVAGFRASFLQREGSLLKNDTTWELKVEQRTYDLLLSTLPWGISMVRLPWMNELLTVEWT